MRLNTKSARAYHTHDHGSTVRVRQLFNIHPTAPVCVGRVAMGARESMRHLVGLRTQNLNRAGKEPHTELLFPGAIQACV